MSMSKWTHAICIPCWNEKNPDRDPITLREEEKETCCFCGAPTTAGIYIREDPNKVLCKGNHN
jgi:hypothetical protein